MTLQINILTGEVIPWGVLILIFANVSAENGIFQYLYLNVFCNWRLIFCLIFFFSLLLHKINLNSLTLNSSHLLTGEARGITSLTSSKD